MEKTKQEISALINEAVALVTPVVKKIESRPMMTKGHYAQYMAVLSEAKDNQTRKRLAATLILAGANRDGVITALALI